MYVCVCATHRGDKDLLCPLHCHRAINSKLWAFRFIHSPTYVNWSMLSHAHTQHLFTHSPLLPIPLSLPHTLSLFLSPSLSFPLPLPFHFFPLPLTLSLTCDSNHSYLWHDSFICEMALLQKRYSAHEQHLPPRVKRATPTNEILSRIRTFSSGPF